MPAAKSLPAYTVDGHCLSLDGLEKFLAGGYGLVKASKASQAAVKKARKFVEELLKRDVAVYGINTGFGKLANTRIPAENLEKLQSNLIRSHSCGVGEPFSEAVVRVAMLLRVNSLCQGHSGVRQEVIDTYLAMINKGVTPWVPRKGSVGASGDLAPLSHVALVAMGEGRAYYKGALMPAAKAMKKAGIGPIQLKAKEGLALINGTQFIQSVGAIAAIKTRKLVKLADLAGAMTLEGLRGTDRAFDQRIAGVRPHPGHAVVAANLRKLLKGSKILASHIKDDPRVQDAYSLRCMPQVHGASRDALNHVCEILEREMNAVTDNPLLFPDDGDVISGGNFHGQPLAIALDYLAIAVAELASISERRIESLVNPDLSHLPPFLVKEAGLSSGMMIAQVTAAALVSENKVLCHPASVDSIPTSANKEDHVSMGVTAARKLAEVVENATRVLEIEVLCARFAYEYHQPLKSSRILESVFGAVRKRVGPLNEDRITYEDFEIVRELLESDPFQAAMASIQ